MHLGSMPTQLKPAKPIRRLASLPSTAGLDAEDKGMRADQANGYGLWFAKVVAARKFGRQLSEQTGEQQPTRRGKWHLLPWPDRRTLRA
jgi:hypothetical protein